ncbi:MAG: MerR family transcriptional regulator [Pseudobdellovibrionaceae bacterium]
MLSIGRFAKLAEVSPRTVRYYESLGLIKSLGRQENNYRYYDRGQLERVAKIRELQGLGFSLDEIKDVLKISPFNFESSLREKLNHVQNEIGALQERRQKLLSLLSVSQKIGSGELINDIERKQYMEAIQDEILSSLKQKHGCLSEKQINYVKRDRSYETPEQREFIAALKKCFEFAKERKLKLGPPRGSASASILLYALGVNSFDPSDYGFFPERLLTQAPNIHIDVEYERGQEFVDFCRETTKSLKYGQIQAFKMPLLDILKNINFRLGKEIPYHEIDENSDLVLSPIRNGDLEKIFHFDMSEDALIMKWEGFLPGYKGLQKITEYVRSQSISNFRDVINIVAVWRPYCQEMVDRIERYRRAKEKPFVYDFLAPELQESLKANYGLVIYHEDILRILAHYTNWDLARCNRFRRDFVVNKKSIDDIEDFQEFKKFAPEEVIQLTMEENPFVFCQPHVVSYCLFTKITAILKSLHKEVYYEEIQKWEQKHGFRWDDIGVNWKGVSLLQN